MKRFIQIDRTQHYLALAKFLSLLLHRGEELELS